MENGEMQSHENGPDNRANRQTGDRTQVDLEEYRGGKGKVSELASDIRRQEVVDQDQGDSQRRCDSPEGSITSRA
jgi:hypothetical protein